MTKRWYPLLFLFLAFSADLCHAHEARPIFVRVTEGAGGEVTVWWRVPKTQLAGYRPRIELPRACTSASGTSQADLGDSYAYHETYTCTGPLAGKTLRVNHPGVNPSLSILFHVQLATGEIQSTLLTPNENSWRIPESESTWSVTRDYVRLGTRHIAGGIDHLMFVTCLLILARTPRRVFITITGFTLAHSVTLALSALEIVHMPPRFIEAGIALSILVLAAELLRNGEQTFTRRYPISVSTLFGLLHGFGFATMLREIGLPTNDTALALFAFNAGVEIGQIAFVLALWAVLGGAARLGRKFIPVTRPKPFALPLQTAALYVIGIASAYWTFERIAAF